MKHGVYQIRNLVNGKRYIGSTADKKGFGARWDKHLWQLSNQKHHSIKLQRAWNKYHSSLFVCEILLYCDPENCLMYEQAALDFYKPEYNVSKIAGSCLGVKRSKASNRRTSKSLMGHPVKQSTKDKLRQQRQGSLGTNAKLTEDQVKEIRMRIKQGNKQINLAKEFGVSSPTITDIKNRKSWRHV